MSTPGTLSSLPVWECGLKFYDWDDGANFATVTPCVGVWIEISPVARATVRHVVTPCVGVWIEIPVPRREAPASLVTPCVGVWIEIFSVLALRLCHCRHSLCGSVD